MNRADVLKFSRLGAAAVEAMWPGVIRIAGVDIACAVRVPNQRGILVMGGEQMDGELVVRIRKDLMPVPPPADTVLIFKSNEWLVRDEPTGDLDTAWTLRCEPKN